MATHIIGRRSAASAKWVEEQKSPTLSLVYLPHLDYDLQRFGSAGEAVALGEIGLDRFHLPKDDPAGAEKILGWQKAAFAEQLRLAKKLGCPVVVHSRGAFAECVGMIDASGVADYLAWMAVPAPRTIYRDIRSLRPGEAARYRGSRLEIAAGWRFSTIAPPERICR